MKEYLETISSAMLSALDRIRHRAARDQMLRLAYKEMLTGFAAHRMLFDGEGNPVDYIFLDVNPAFERLTGLKRKDVIGRRASSVVPGLEKIWIETYGNVVRTGNSNCFEGYAGGLGRHYMVVAFRLHGDDFGVTFYETSQVHILQARLQEAYDATLEGWAKAVELRDKVTEGHSRRVSQWTIAMCELHRARSAEALKVIWRGAMLHDIGKIGIPDGILLKPGALTEEERKVIEQHPVLAYNWLHPIAYLRPSLDIPYCHHEHWDGNGYPRGLAGEEIPEEARLFSVVDVWDALTSNRPYRPAWEVSRAIDYIQQASGSLFWPEAVRMFLEHRIWES